MLNSFKFTHEIEKIIVMQEMESFYLSYGTNNENYKILMQLLEY